MKFTEVFILNISIDSKRFVTSVQNGLTNARNEIYVSNTLTDNRKHMEKWDYIVTAVKESFEHQEKYSFIPLDRGLFKPIMIFDKEEKTLYTIIKNKNFDKLLNRKSIDKIHYIDAMLDYNLSYQTTPEQITWSEMDNMFSDNAVDKIRDLQTNIETMLCSDEIKEYITIVIDFNGYTLTDAKAVLCSKWLEIIYENDWKEFITPSYNDIEDNGKIDFVQETEIKSMISLKPTVRKADEIG